MGSCPRLWPLAPPGLWGRRTTAAIAILPAVWARSLCLLSACLATAPLYLEWATASGLKLSLDGLGRVRRLQWNRLQLELFVGRVSMLESSATEGSARVLFVGKACELAASALINNTCRVIL